MIGILGATSTIAKEFIRLEDCEWVGGRAHEISLDCDQYLICSGILHGQKMSDMTQYDIMETMRVNFIEVADFCSKVLDKNGSVRICIIGSESGFSGSYDDAYACSKAAIHHYIETTRVGRNQHLVGVAPTIIEDSYMTTNRKDLNECLERGQNRRMGRWLKAKEVAKVAKFALENDSLCNTVIRMPGGNW